MIANILPIISLPMALRNLPVAVNGLPLVPIGNDIQALIKIESQMHNAVKVKTRKNWMMQVLMRKKK